MRTIRYLGELLTSAIFIIGGGQAFMEPGQRVAKVEAAGLPEPRLGVELNGAVMVAGGVALGLGIFPRVAATLLAVSLVPTTLIGHAFWKETASAARKAQTTQFLKNLAMLGALLFIIADPGERD